MKTENRKTKLKENQVDSFLKKNFKEAANSYETYLTNNLEVEHVKAPEQLYVKINEELQKNNRKNSTNG